MLKKIISGFVIIASLASMLAAPAAASGLTQSNKSYGRYDLEAGSDNSDLYSVEYKKDGKGNTTGVDLKFLQTKNSREVLFKYEKKDGTDAKFVHNRLLMAIEDCGVESSPEDLRGGFRIAHSYGSDATRQINVNSASVSIFDGSNIARGYVYSNEAFIYSTTDTPYYNTLDWIWDCENGIEYYFMNGRLAAYVTCCAKNGKFYGFEIEKMDEKIDMGDVLSVRYDDTCPGHTIYIDTADHKVTLDEVIEDANIKNCNFEDCKKSVNANLREAEEKTHKQTKEFNVTGTGLCIQAEDCCYNGCYDLKYDRKASGTNVLYSQGYFPSTPVAATPEHFQLQFTVDTTATYNIWVRSYAGSTKSDALYSSINGDSYASFKVKSGTSDYVWNCLGVKKLNAGELNTLNIRVFEGANYMDAFLITKIGTFKPEGRYGGLPETYSEDLQFLDGSSYPETPYSPPANVHPRVMFNKDDIPRIKKNMESDEAASALKRYNELLNSDIGEKYSITNLMRVQANALDYVINGNKKNGRKAIEGIKNQLVNNSYVGASTINDTTTRNGGYIIYVTAEVYDWCHDLLTDDEKKELISGCEVLAMTTENGWPPENQGALTGHAAESQFQRDVFALAIATYDERPDLWEFIGGRYYKYYEPIRRMFPTSFYQGGSYGQYRQMWASWGLLLLRGMGAELPVDKDVLGESEYWSIYFRRPDGQTLRDGDEAQDKNFRMWEYWKTYPANLLNCYALSGNKYLKYEYARRTENMEYYNGSLQYASPVEFLILNDSDVAPAKTMEDLPLSKYWDEPYGLMVARTGWEDGVEAPDVVAEMKFTTWYTSNHQHLDCGHFQIYYKGILASDSGVYQGAVSTSGETGYAEYWSPHTNQYATKTIAHNCMLVYDPKEGDKSSTDRGVINDGGQRQFNNGGEYGNLYSMMEKYNTHVSDVEGHEIDPKNPNKPEYTYLKGNLKNAYTDKVSEYKRSFMFLNLENSEVPAAMIVFDRISSSDASYKKTWLLHGLEEPTINGNRTIFTNNYQSGKGHYGYNGKLTVDTLLPKENTISKIGGEGMFSYVNGIDYTGTPLHSHTDEGNTWRMELSPKNPSKEDYFLNVLQVSDYDKENYMPTQIIDTNEFYGAAISDRIAAFSKSGNRVGGSFTITAPENKAYKFTICDVEAGEYNVSIGGTELKCYATEDGGVLSFEGNGDTAVIKKVGTEVVSEESTDEPNQVNEAKVLVKLNNVFIYNSRPALLEYATVKVDQSFIEKHLDATAAGDEKTIEFTKDDKKIRFTNGSDIININGSESQMSDTAEYKDGGWYIPARAAAEALNVSISWDKFSRIVSMKYNPDYSLPDGYAKVVKIADDGGERDYPVENVVDQLYATHWAAEGIGRYFTMELENAAQITGVEISFNPHATEARDARFEVLVSADGVEYQSVYTGVSDGSVDEGAWEKFNFDKAYNAKYVRYVANGSNVNKWNAIKEFRIKLK